MHLRNYFGLALVATLALSCEGRPRAVKDSAGPHYGGDGQLVVFDLTQPVPEAAGQDGFFPTPVAETFAGLIQDLKVVEKNNKRRGYLVRFGSQSFDWAQTEELSRLFSGVRQGDKPIYCHADDLGNINYWLAAAACDEIWLSPAGSLEGVGIAGQSLYLKGLLDRFRVKAESLHMGRYKSAAETLTRDGPTEAAKESMLSVLRSIRSAWLDGLAAAKPEAGVQEKMENGPWDPPAAAKAGLVDHVGYESEARMALKAKTESDQFVTPAGEEEKRQESASGLAELTRLLSGAEATEAPHVAILAAEGSISMEGGGFTSSGGIVAPAFIRQVRRLKNDDSVKAVVLRLNSPGGSALASDLMWHELMELRAAKPVIASVGGMAASGGYFMAVASDYILAERTSIVGSIGVVGGKIMLGDALAEFGVNTYTFAASEAEGAAARAAYLSPFIEWNEETRAKVQSQMANIYELFLERVAKGRDKPVDEIRKVAEGRIWSGAQGKENGLVDELGGLERAIEVALEKAKLPSNAPVVIQQDTASWLEMLGLSDDADEAAIRAAAVQRQAFRPASRPSWLPLAAQLGLTTAQKHHIDSLSPLLGGEAVIVALPFAFSAQ